MDRLPPINHKENEAYNAFSQSTPVEFLDCKHSDIKFNKEKHELRCKCGVAFTGERLGELYTLLTKNR